MVRLVSLGCLVGLPIVLAQGAIHTPEQTTSTSNYALYHRALNPNDPSTQRWSKRSEISFSDVHVMESPEVQGLELSTSSEGEQAQDYWYQIALGSDGATDEEEMTQWGMSGLRLCHLSAQNATLDIRTTPNGDHPVSIKLSLASTSKPLKSAQCPDGFKLPSSAKIDLVVKTIKPQSLAPLKASIHSSPDLSSPINPATGQPTLQSQKGKKEEKSFLGKYWLYILGAMMIVGTMAGDPGPEEAGKGKAPVKAK